MKKILLAITLMYSSIFVNAQTDSTIIAGNARMNLTITGSTKIDTVHGWVGYYRVWKPDNWRNVEHNSSRDSAMEMVYEPALGIIEKNSPVLVGGWPFIEHSGVFGDQIIGILIYQDIYESQDEADKRGHLIQKRIRTELRHFDLSKYHVFIPDADVFQYREIR
jgi:hypothetical protein